MVSPHPVLTKFKYLLSFTRFFQQKNPVTRFYFIQLFFGHSRVLLLYQVSQKNGLPPLIYPMFVADRPADMGLQPLTQRRTTAAEWQPPCWQPPSSSHSLGYKNTLQKFAIMIKTILSLAFANITTIFMYRLCACGLNNNNNNTCSLTWQPGRQPLDQFQKHCHPNIGADFRKSLWVHVRIPSHPSPFFPLPFPALLSPPLPSASLSSRAPQNPAGVFGERCKLPQLVRAAPGRQSIFVTLCTWKPLFLNTISVLFMGTKKWNFTTKSQISKLNLHVADSKQEILVSHCIHSVTV